MLLLPRERERERAGGGPGRLAPDPGSLRAALDEKCTGTRRGILSEWLLPSPNQPAA